MFSQFAFLDFGAPELIIILAILLLLFGSKKLPDLSRSLGQSARELRKGLNEDVHENKKETEKPQSDNKAS